VTIKAVRHYHQRGLLPEPSRDASGYRRYSAEDAIALIKIKTLADAGVPLARIKELLAADPAHLAAATAEIEGTLQERADELLRTRERIARLGSGDRMFVSADVADYLDRLRELGVSQRMVQAERDGWILMQSVSPNEAAIWLTEKREALADPQFRAIYLEYDAAFDWSPDDPRLYALADRTRRWFDSRSGGPKDRVRSPQDPTLAKLVAASGGARSPAWDRLTEIVKERMAGGEGGSPRRRAVSEHA
jgi:DNA-binding transcriptional MerR regulator